MVVLDNNEIVYEDNGGIPQTTNQVMELFAVIAAFKWVSKNRPSSVTIVSDSEYVVKGINERMENWKRRGWRTNAGDPVKNKSFWVHAYGQYNGLIDQGIHIDLQWVRGHDGNHWNEYADQLAVEGKMQAITAYEETVR